MKKLTIAGETFDVSTPYTDGQADPNGDMERKTLDQVRSENIGNNLRGTVKEMLSNNASFNEIQAKISEYDTKYTFSMGGGREPLDPLDRECRKVAREAIRDHLAADGRKLKDVEDAALEAAIDKVAAQDDVIAEAKKRIKAREKKAKINLEGLGLQQPT